MVVICNKKKMIVLFSALCFILLLFISFNRYSTILEVFKEEKENALNEYKICVELEDKEKLLKCNQEVAYVNNTNKNLDKIYFHIYPNAFSKKEYAPFEENEWKEAYPNGFDKGYIKIKKVAGKNYDISYKIMGEKEDILEINLGNKLKPGEKTNIILDYEVKLPNSIGRFGYGEYTFNITNWYPIACVYDDRGWNQKSYEPIGDPFYSEVSNFKVNISMPSKYELAATGKVADKTINRGNKLYKIKADKVRDFAFIISDQFHFLSEDVGDTRVHSYFFNEKLGKKSLEAAKDSLEIFNTLFGKYPYKTYSVVASDFFIGGMEYPNLVMIDKTLYEDNLAFYLEYVIAHETAHQWWYSMVGNDEISEPWLDEALTEYSTILYFENKYGKDVKDRLIKELKVKTSGKSIENVFKETKEFENSREYSLCVYSKGALVLDAIRNKVGDDVFFGTLREYYKKNMYKNVKSKAFLEMWKEKGITRKKIIDGNI